MGSRPSAIRRWRLGSMACSAADGLRGAGFGFGAAGGGGAPGLAAAEAGGGGSGGSWRPANGRVRHVLSLYRLVPR